MKISLFFLLLCVCLETNAQMIRAGNDFYSENEKYFSFNPFSLFEPQMAAGIGLGNRFSERSEYFSELSYISKSPFYNSSINYLHGFRLIVHYRYHFLQRWRPIFDRGLQKRRSRANPFMGFEFRIKAYDFSGRDIFINNPTNTILSDYLYKARASSFGGAIIWGGTYNISRNNRWKIEVTAGIGVKQKFVRFKNLPQGYQLYEYPPREWGYVPEIDKAISTPYFPLAIRLRYVID